MNKEEIGLEIKKFLDNTKETQTVISDRTLIKVRYDDNFDLIFCNDWHDMGFDAKFEYMCFYNKKTQQCYGHGFYPFYDVSYIQSTERPLGYLRGLIAEKISEWANSFTPKSAKELGGKIRDEEYFMKYTANNRARDLLADGLNHNSWNCAYNTTIEELDMKFNVEETLYSTLNPEEVATKYFERYKEKHLESVLSFVMENGVIYDRMVEMEKDPSNIVFKVARIRKSIDMDSQKTVTLTINKKKKDSDEYAEMTFKYPTRDLYYGVKNDYCSSYNIPAQDRAVFEELFGRSADVLPQDIVKIEYSKKVLFEEK